MEQNKFLIKKKYVDRVIDFLKEEAYLSDIIIYEEDYNNFFGIIYDYFSSNDLQNLYLKMMMTYISESISSIEQININVLCDSLEQFINGIHRTNYDYSFINIDEIRNYVSQKNKVLTLNN